MTKSMIDVALDHNDDLPKLQPIDIKVAVAGEKGDPGRDGVDGKDGRDGVDGKTPEHEADKEKGRIRFKRPDGKWGKWVNIKGDDGESVDPEMVLEEIKAHLEMNKGDLIGPAGPVGPGFNLERDFRGAWSSASRYTVNQIVTYSGNVYFATNGSVNKQPDTETSHWTLFAALVGGSSAWGDITGTLSAQTDLQSALDAKQAEPAEGAFVDGDKTKLDGIEALADVTDATNVNAAGATMNTDTDVSTNSWVLDEDTMTSDSATKVPTQQSVKAYVDANGGSNLATHKFTTAETWAALDSLGAETITQVTIDTNAVTNGSISYSVDAGTAVEISNGTQTTVIVAPSSDLDIISNDASGYDLSTAVYDSKSFDFTGETTITRGVSLKSDGTKMYITDPVGDEIEEYALSTAWDVTTATHTDSLNISADESNPAGMDWKPDGTIAYLVGYAGDEVNQYSCSTAWDISTWTLTDTFSVSGQDLNPFGFAINTEDGTTAYITGGDGDDINQYTLSTAWDMGTASYSKNFSISSQDTDPQGVKFNADGTKMFVLGAANDKVYEYNLSTGWDIATAVYSQEFSVQSEDSSPYGLWIDDNGERMYIAGSTNDKIFQYSMGGSFAGTGYASINHV